MIASCLACTKAGCIVVGTVVGTALLVVAACMGSSSDCMRSALHLGTGFAPDKGLAFVVVAPVALAVERPRLGLLEA